ncbi:hypothetical protein [Mesorhizobium sp.]|uniref:hypothetical protein n=1 Tax=Mesorhizobium sp. TaxID=1871066 RepID=UPI000FE5F479|nr:hypothetical protein [Mesorhizobium sp.]RWN31749.1 MAG: hypothetical protein EOR95_18375 [Mesorhizobium sp.]
MRRLERDFGNTRTKSAGSSGSQAALDDGGANRRFADKGAARNERRNIQASGKNRTKRAVPTRGVDRSPVFIFHVDLRFHRLEGRTVKNRHEPIGAALVFRPLDLAPNLIASEAVARGNIDAGKLVVPARNNGVVLPKVGGQHCGDIWRNFRLLRRQLVVDGAERAEGRTVFRVLQDWHQGTPRLEPSPSGSTSGAGTFSGAGSVSSRLSLPPIRS